MTESGALLESRFEVLPLGTPAEEAERLPERVKLTVTCSPRHGIDRSVEVAERLAALGHQVVVHLAARMIRDGEHLDEVLGRFARAGMDDVFLIAGDAAQPLGPYASADELLPVLAAHPHRPATIGIAGYPEGHPLVAPEVLAEVLERKSALASYIVTQMCFDPKALERWVRETRARGVALPVHVGIPGAVDRRKLLEISMRVGVGPSLKYVRKQRGLRKLLRPADATVALHEALVDLAAEPGAGIVGLHFFTFNRLLETWQWAERHPVAAPTSPSAASSSRTIGSTSRPKRSTSSW